MDDEKEAILPISNRDLLPKDELDRGLFLLMTIGIPSLFVWESSVLYRYHPDFDSTWVMYLSIQGFILVNVIGNLYYLQRVDSSGKNKNLPTVIRPNWKYCHFCQINSPPRSYHCAICDECILKRDQHCMFAGCCVGFYNHRYYFVAVIYILIGAFYAFILLLPHCIESIGGFQLLPMISLAAPHIAVLFGVISIYGFLCAIIQIMLLCVNILTAYLLVVQIRCISQGQTIHEKRAGITLYDLGWSRNFVQVLGRQWHWALLCPFARSSVPGDGIDFVTFYDLEEIKNV